MLYERCNLVPHCELIVPGGHLTLRSIYQFKNADEVYAFLHGCHLAKCSVCFQNEDILQNQAGDMNVPDIAIAVYMGLKDNPNLVESYLRFLVKCSREEWSTDQVEVI